MAIDLTYLTQAYNESRLALVAFNAGKKGTALDHAGQGVSYVGKFTAAALNESAEAPSILTDASAMSDDELLTAIDNQIIEANSPGAKAISPGLALLIQLLLSRLLKRLLPVTP